MTKIDQELRDYREARLINGQYVLEYQFMGEIITTEPGNWTKITRLMADLFKIGMTNVTIKKVGIKE